MGAYLNLLTGAWVETSEAQDRFEERKTREFKARTGECGNACRYDTTFGWVPECGCPIHDPD